MTEEELAHVREHGGYLRRKPRGPPAVVIEEEP